MVASEETRLAGVSRPAPAIPSAVLAAVAVVVAVVVLAVAVVLVSRPGSAYPADSPEAAVQRFLEAHDRDDPDAAYAMFSSSVREDVSAREYRAGWRAYAWLREQDRQVVLDRTDTRGDRATVHLEVTYGDEGIFGGGRHTAERSVALLREDGEWRIDEVLIGLENDPYLWGEM